MAAITRTSPKRFLGASIPNTKVLSSKIDEVIIKVNDMSSTDGTVLADTISPNTTGTTIIKTTAGLVEKHTATAFPTTATITAAQLSTGYITSLTAAAVSLTLPTATDLGTALGATSGTSFEFIIDVTGGANTLTVLVNTGITAATPVITGGGTLTVSVANAIGIFRIVFSSATVAKLYRIG